ncbi:MAG: hypothetical protein ACQEVA_19335 [Myxococcota bacterium]
MTTSSTIEPDERPAGAHDPQERQDDGFVASRFYGAAWSIVRRDLLLVVWKLIGDFASSVLSLVLGVTAAMLLFIAALAGLSDPTASGPLVGIMHFIGRPGFAIGALGILGTIWMSSLAFDAIVTGGIWNVLARGARGESIRPFHTFFAGAFTRFPQVLGLRISSGAVQLTMVFLLGTVVFAILEATTGWGALQAASPLTKSLLWASSLTAFFALSALARLAIEIAAAPLFVGQHSLGEALLEGARLVGDRFLEVYRILIFAAALWLGPLVIYWVVLMGQNLTMDQPGLSAAFTVVRLLAELLLFVATALISIHLYGAYFFYWAKERGYIDALPSTGGERDGKRVVLEADETVTDDGEAAEPEAVEETLEGTTLEDLIPAENPFRFDVDELVAHSRHAKNESDTDSDNESDIESDTETKQEKPT